jgi:hypothetical protein
MNAEGDRTATEVSARHDEPCPKIFESPRSKLVSLFVRLDYVKHVRLGERARLRHLS